ncbi:MAG: hypothetical protein ACHP78_17755, partial [Terriglobales bacterium]
MKLGAENRTKLIVLAVLAVGTVLSVGYMFNSLGGGPPQVVAVPASRGNATAQPSRPGTRGPAIAIAASSLDPELRLPLLESSEGTKYEGSGRNIFVPGMEDIPHPIAPGMPGGKPLPPQ